MDNPATLPVPEHPGILDRDGWYLMDDTRTALLNAGHTVTDRPSHGSQPYEDGYFFGYGQDYKQGLADLNALTGPTALLPESAYGVWYSRYYPYTTSDYQNTLLPAFRSNFTPIDWLVVDTDWKSPSTWNGWNWSSSLFPDPQAFMDWTKAQGLSVSMNIHTSIQGDDPKFAAVNSQARRPHSGGHQQHLRLRLVQAEPTGGLPVPAPAVRAAGRTRVVAGLLHRLRIVDRLRSPGRARQPDQPGVRRRRRGQGSARLLLRPHRRLAAGQRRRQLPPRTLVGAAQLAPVHR